MNRKHRLSKRQSARMINNPKGETANGSLRCTVHGTGDKRARIQELMDKYAVGKKEQT